MLLPQPLLHHNLYPWAFPWMHFAQHCLLGLEVHYLSTAKQEELLLQLLATKDVAKAPSPDELAPELAPEESGACVPLLGVEEDF
ncbi:hypothetical protein C0993_007884 [Termitomyces sp. T159_Od127]|nr:hypothetical protein C0993_007884 [Termitomyces sp. T159_Od127]